MSPDEHIALIGAAALTLGSVVGWLSGRRPNKAKATVDEVTAYSVLVKDLRTEVDRIRELHDASASENTTLLSEVRKAQQQVAQLQFTVDQLAELLNSNGIPVPFTLHRGGLS